VDDLVGVDLDASFYALDSTTIDLCLSLFSRARFRWHKAAIKLDTLLATAWSEAISGPASTDAPVQRSLLLAVSMGAEQAVGWRREHGQSSRRFRASDCTGRRCPRRLAGGCFRQLRR
jgi:hypothetical protein